ncbi:MULTISPECIES: hypothetical protein [Pseudomonas]|jgi:hypothetical protein|uniref:Uncharacterized protein n=1 Tax=Pseudomonas putida TaxID=303 RepID=A0A9X8EJ18_PSEPU|nr:MULTISPECIES: hypothetical protein [Pseudomonas]KIU46526.1 hypothetical protein QV12_21130 [Pseudomonas putida]KTC19706.1 hypothetical protein AO392_15040 [Pseudomonas putida]MCO7507011.1 hypothetical protein [Pseudomonas sp. VE 267-6A]MCO7532192.1 hypothetical protein [Pseudomonas sp. 2]MCP8348170.1 hypothetical protein [Pseudomonas sp. FBF18]
MEASSLYFRCNITPAQYQAAVTSPAAGAGEFDDWQQWLDAAEVHGVRDLDQKAPENAVALGDLLQGWVDCMYGSLMQYDEASQVWQFALVEFTNNYGEMIQLLAPLRQMAKYAKPESDSFLLVYSYIWGDGDNAFLTLGQQRSQFASGPSPEQRAEADGVLEGLAQALQQQEYDYD